MSNDQRQRDLESLMVDRGRAKVDAAVDRATAKAAFHTAPGWIDLIPAMMAAGAPRRNSKDEIVEDGNGRALRESAIFELGKQVSKRGRNRAQGVKELVALKLKPEQIFLIGATAVIECVGRGEQEQWAVRRIAKFLQTEVRMREFQKEERKQYKRLEAKAAERFSQDLDKRAAVFNRAARKATYESCHTDWDYPAGVRAGTLVLSCLKLSGLVESFALSTLKRGKWKTSALRLTPAGEEYLESRTEAARMLARPTFRPMLVAPVSWTPDDDGGYLELHKQVPMVKSRYPQDVERLRAADMPQVYAGLNTIQATGWRVNEDVMVTAAVLREGGGGRAGLPESQGRARPDKPVGLWPEEGSPSEFNEVEAEAFRVWVRQTRDAHDAEAARSSQHTQVTQILQVAEDFKVESAFFFPHQLDWRGRCYPTPSQFNPQGTDLAKGLLMFSEGRELGEMGAYWLAVHGANCWGEDKAPLNQRVDWVCANDDLIKAIATDPLTERTWEDADSPFQFLAFCLEWAAYLEDGESEEFLSYLPVGMDGSCNGLQHFSAMLRDPVGAEATNLVPCETPNDIYTQVACAVSERVSEIAYGVRGITPPDAEYADREWVFPEPERRLAKAWKAFGISRSIVKRQVMTTPYGVTEHGGLAQLVKQLDHEPGAKEAFEDGNTWQAAHFLSPIIFQVIGEVVKASQDVKEFLQGLAQALAKHDLPVAWTTPSGFPVRQEYMRSDTFRVTSKLAGTTNLRYAYDSNQMDKARQVRGISPNFVHSYDAAHLALTVVAAEREAGRRLSWQMVHDSFGTHAGDVDLMSRVLRRIFVELYEDRTPLADLLEATRERLPEGTSLPDVPNTGSFDLNLVLGAEFFFA
ncbi:MAG: DNA-directed RNA polymerase [Dehalococcoidia bacterium]